MLLHNKGLINFPLYTEGEAAPVAGKSMDIGDMADFLKDDTPDPKDIKVDDKKDDDTLDIKIDDDDTDDEDAIDLKDDKEDKPEDKDDEDKDEEDELDETDEYKLELVDHVSRKEILKQFPDLFKKFPYLERAYYRNLQFTEYFSKPEEAKAAVEAQATLQNFEKQLLSGDVKDILKAVKEENQESFHKLIDNYLTTLEEVDPKMWEHVVGNLNKQTIYAMFAEGKSTDNKDMMKAALMLNQFIFGTSKYTPPEQLSKKSEKTDREKELEEKEKSFNEKRFNTHKTELESRVSNTIKNTIEQNIDPKGSLDNQFVKDKAIEDAITNLNKLMTSDQKYVKNMKLLWAKAAEADYSQESLNAIKSATINKAKTLIKGVIRDTRNKVFKNNASRKSTEDKGSRKGPLPQGKPASQNSGHKNSPVEIKPGDSTMDVMMRD